MARRKKEELESDYQGTKLDEFFDSLCAEAVKHFGVDNVYTGSESERQVIGIPLPALSICYLFQSNILALSRMGQIVGEEGCCKSSLLYEIFRWLRLMGGRSVLLEAETKDSPDLRRSILNYDDKAVIVKPCDSLEDWQEGLTHFIKWAKRLLDGTKTEPGPGRIIPFGYGVDSLMGKGCRATIEKIMKEGSASRSFPAEALLISQYMRFMPSQIAKWPFVVWGINHLKPATDPITGIPKPNIAGGKSLKFQETYEIEMHRVKDIKKVDVQGLTLKMVMRKNSLGPSRTAINVDMLWWYDEDTGIQRTVFDWNAASINLLLSFEGSKLSKLQDACDLHVTDKGKKLVWSNALGIPRSDPVSFSQAGEALEKNPEIMDKLFQILHIRKMPVFKTGVAYNNQLEQAKLKSKEIGEQESMEDVKVPENLEEE